MAQRDWYQEITDRMIALVEEAIRDNKSWAKSWKGTWAYGLPVRANGQPFTGINVWILALAGHTRGYTDPRWFTFNQAMEALGYKRNPDWKSRADSRKGIRKWIWTGEGEDPRYGVRKGETGTHVVRVNRIPIYQDQDGDRVYPPRKGADKAEWEAKLASGKVKLVRHWTNLASYVVFNAEQIEGMSPEVQPLTRQEDRYLLAESLFAALPIKYDVREGCDTAAYLPQQDRIILPSPEQFESMDHFWATAFHEVIHWTGHESRMGRAFGMKGTPEYAFEELVAEMGSAFLCAYAGLEGNLRHPEYLAQWLRVLREDKRAMVRAATLAQKAMDFVLSGGQVAETHTEEEKAA